MNKQFSSENVEKVNRQLQERSKTTTASDDFISDLSPIDEFRTSEETKDNAPDKHRNIIKKQLKQLQKKKKSQRRMKNQYKNSGNLHAI